jgi:hypothetical protein
MNHRCCRLSAGLALLLSPALLWPVLADGPTGSEWSTCRAIVEDAARLACYDRLATAIATAVPPALPAAPAATVRAGAGQAGDFGAEAVRKPQTSELSVLSATVLGVVDGIRRDQILTLDNGQRWRVIDDKEIDLVANAPKARIERNLIGTYWMRLGERGPAFKVRRLQ